MEREMDFDLYNTTTSVVRAVTTLSNHCHTPPQFNCSVQLQTDVMKIAEEIESFYGTIDQARSILTNVSQGQVSEIISIQKLLQLKQSKSTFIHSY